MKLSSLKSIKPLDAAIKAVGVIGVGSTLYDAHHWGKLKSFERKNTRSANAGFDYFNNTQYLDDKSHITSNIKQKLFNLELMNPIRDPWNSTVGYLGGFCSNLARSIVPLGASIGALALKGKGAKISTAALGVYAVGSFFTNVCSNFKHRA